MHIWAFSVFSSSANKLHAAVFVLFYFTTAIRAQDVLLVIFFFFFFFRQRDSTSSSIAYGVAMYSSSRESVAIDAKTEWLLKFKAYINIPHIHTRALFHSLTRHTMPWHSFWLLRLLFFFRCALSSFSSWTQLSWAELYYCGCAVLERWNSALW